MKNVWKKNLGNIAPVYMPTLSSWKIEIIFTYLIICNKNAINNFYTFSATFKLVDWRLLLNFDWYKNEK